MQQNPNAPENNPAQPNRREGPAHIDEVAALAALDGDRALLCDLASMFVEDAPQVVAELRAAVQADHPLEARRAVHSLKGLVSTFYAAEARDLADRLEHEAAGLKLDTFKSGGCDALELAVVTVIDALKARSLVH